MCNEKSLLLEILPVIYIKGSIAKKIRPLSIGEKIDRQYIVNKNSSFSASFVVTPYYKSVL